MLTLQIQTLEQPEHVLRFSEKQKVMESCERWKSESSRGCHPSQSSEKTESTNMGRKVFAAALKTWGVRYPMRERLRKFSRPKGGAPKDGLPDGNRKPNEE